MVTEELKIILSKKSDDLGDSSGSDKDHDPEEGEKEIFDPNEEGLDDLGVEEVPEDNDNPLEPEGEDGNY